MFQFPFKSQFHKMCTCLAADTVNDRAPHKRLDLFFVCSVSSSIFTERIITFTFDKVTQVSRRHTVDCFEYKHGYFEDDSLFDLYVWLFEDRGDMNEFRDNYDSEECLYNAMQCNAMQCNAMQCNAMQCNAMQCNAMQCNKTLLFLNRSTSQLFCSFGLVT